MSHARLALLSLSLALLGGLVHAGPSAGGRISDRLREILRDLPEDRIHTGILYDRVAPLSPVAEHDGTRDDVPTRLREWKEMYSEIANAGPRNASSFAPLADAIAPSEADARRGVTPIVVLNSLYDRFVPDAFKRGLLVASGGRVELGAGSGDPFEVHRLFAAAPLREETFRGSEVRFRLDRSGYLTNDPSPVTSIEIDFADGRGFVPVAFGEVRTVRYAAPGEKSVRLQVETAGGSVLRTSFLYDVQALTTPAPNDTLHVTATIPYQGVYGTGDAYVYLSDSHTTLTEPVVVLEGFDPENTMNWDELYALLNRENLLENLRAMGFDAVILNYANGADYVQRNAFVAVELIREIEGMIAPGKTMALVGASMGGLVGRYALAYMEANGIPHDVRTFISFDGPHAGADVPLGMQYWLWFFSSDSQDAAAYLADLDTPAARQMLVYHYTDPPGGTGSADPLRASLLGDMAAVGGYPTALRKVAIANGSGDRVNQGFVPGAEIIQWEYSSFVVSFIGDSWAVPDGAAQTIFHGKISYFYVPWSEATVNVSGTRPYDGAPGGWRDSMAQLAAVDPGYGDIIAPYPNHCFIPTISSLALQTTDLFYDIAGDADILQHTPFDAVYFPTENQEHVDINAQNAPWFIAEITQGASGVAEGVGVPPTAARIVSVSPNPFDAATRIRFTLPAGGPVSLSVFDPGGRRVAVITDRPDPAGESNVVWDGRDAAGERLAPGVYFVELRGRGFAASRKILVR